MPSNSVRIVYIHGANASSTSFNYIRDHIKTPSTMIEYSCESSFWDNLDAMFTKLSKTRSPLFFVAHSLGGIYALHLSALLSNQTTGAVTISTPYGGSREADKARIFAPYNRLIQDIGTSAEPVRKVKQLPTPSNWTGIVSTGGSSPFIAGANDGVVTVESQTALSDRMHIVRFPVNHYEAVLLPATVKTIERRAKKAVS